MIRKPAVLSSRVRQALPIALLLAALGVSGVGAVEAYRTQRTHRATAESLLRDYGTFAAWSYKDKAAAVIDEGVRSLLRPHRIALLAGRNPEGCLEDLLTEALGRTDCRCSDPLGGGFAFMYRLAGEGAPRLFVGDPPVEADDRAALMASVARVSRSPSGNSGAGIVEAADGAGRTMLLAWARVAERSDTLLYGFEVSPERLEAVLADALQDERLLPESLTRGAANDEMLAVSVALPSGRVLYATGREAAVALAGEQEWPDALGGGVVRAAVLPSVADQLIIGGLPRSQAPWLVVIFALSAGLALVAVTYLRREMLLARQREDFVASVSHELRTPLAQIRLFVETLRLGRTQNEVQREWALASVDRETLRLTRLVENVLQFSRTDRGWKQLEPQPLSLAEEAAGVVEAFRPLLRPRQAQIELDVPSHIEVETDRDSLRQVLLNLLDNAVKYGPPGQTIRVRGRGRGSIARLEIEDEGPGVPPAERNVIWESFRRGERAVGSVVVGSGIGLSVVRALVTRLGGRCHVEDGDAGGARFVVELPALVVAGAEPFAGDAYPAMPTPALQREPGRGAAGVV